jgi:isopenicillin-N epimerase
MEDLSSDRCAKHFHLDATIDYLNHGSFGACPIPVMRAQQELREQIERGPTKFLARDLEGLLDTARKALAALIDAPPEHLAFVTNATTGVNIVLNALDLSQGDELLATNHTYNACKSALAHYAARAGAKLIVVDVPFPIEREEVVLERLLAGVTGRTKLLLIDHITSPTGLLLPIERIISEMHARGVKVLVDGAHAPGQVPLSMRAIGADYYTGNCHKWLCTPKGCAFLYVADTSTRVPPLVISHGAISLRTDRPRLWLEHDWIGTIDPSAFLCIPTAIDFLSGLFPEGLAGLQQRNRRLALATRDRLCEALHIDKPAPDSMIASLVAVPLPARPNSAAATAQNPLQKKLYETHKIEAIVSVFPAYPARLLRVSAQAYNHTAQYERLITALLTELALEAQA